MSWRDPGKLRSRINKNRKRSSDTEVSNLFARVAAKNRTMKNTVFENIEQELLEPDSPTDADTQTNDAATQTDDTMRFLNILHNMKFVDSSHEMGLVNIEGGYLYVIFLYVTDNNHESHKFAYVGQSGQKGGMPGRGLVTKKNWFQHTIRKFVPAVCKVIEVESWWTPCEPDSLDFREYELFLEVQWELNDFNSKYVRGSMCSRHEFPFTVQHPSATAPNILFALQNRRFTTSNRAGEKFL